MPIPLLLKRIVNRLGHPLGINPFPRAFENPIAETAGSASQIFETIYQENYWASDESRSGVGSESTFASAYRQRLACLLKQQGISSIFDAPCGDLNWIAPFISQTQIQYLGGDISPSVVQAAQFAHPTIQIQVFDITRNPFPPVDLWHCRDCLFHLPFEMIEQALANFARSSIPFALITTHHSRLFHQNLNVQPGGFRLLDLEKPPISLPKPLALIRDYRPGRDFPRYMCLWSREQIESALNDGR